MASRYEALSAFLADRSDPILEITFAELDRLIGGLPASARRHQAWWANSYTAQPHARYWLDARRRATPDFNSGRVRFVLGAASAPNPRTDGATHRRNAPLTATGETVDASVHFEWLDCGDVALDASARPVFPGLPSRPAVYRFLLKDSHGELLGVYIGESDDLDRRMRNYRNPGPTQPTNQRLHVRICDVLTSGGDVGVSVALEVAVDGAVGDLARRSARLLAENAALVRAADGDSPVENL